MSDEEKIKAVFKKIAPYIQADGGQIHFIAYKEGVVYIKLGGNCVGCGLIDLTIGEGLEVALRKEVPTIKAIKILEGPY